MEVAADRAYDDARTVIPAEYARGLYVRNAPGALALKLMHLMIASAGGRMAEPVAHEVRLADIRAVQGMKNHDRASLTPIFEELRGAVLSYDDPEAMKWTIGGFLDEAVIDYRHETGGELLISWWFGAAFRRMAAKSDHWAIIDRQTVYALTSKYSILLFQHFASLQNLDHKTVERFTVPRLRELLGVPEGKIKRFADLNRDALKPAITEINQLARFTLTAKANKLGRTVVSVDITWEPKPDPAETRRELERAMAMGRKARRDGAAETLPPCFPSSGSVKHDKPWEDLARAYAKRLPGGHLPDLGALAGAFRDWCRAKGIPLDAPGIEKTFVGFCKSYQPPFPAG